MSDIEYIIYVRKSTDESSGQQTQSIPDQINKCIRYAEANDLKIMAKPQNFEFETDTDIAKENNESDEMNAEIFKKTRGLYIVKEQQSAKVPGMRPKWKKIISLIKQGKIKGLLSYSPDRQARNSMEGGELINCVDNGQIDLKYTNFYFENTASGKMMLGIWFVFSKQYSDKLSEDITRGKKSSVERGKSQGRYKYGYYRDPEDGYYKPHEKYFPLMKEAFQMKLYMGASNEYIAEWLNKEGFFRENKKETKEVSAKMLYMVWIDEFYYGIYIYGDSIVDMREANPYYQPLISEDEHCILLEKSKSKARQTLLSTKEDKYAEIRPLSKGLFKTPDGYGFVPYVASVARLEKKLVDLKKLHKGLELKDIVKPHQIRYRMMQKVSKFHGVEFTFDLIDKMVLELFSRVVFTETEYQKMVRAVGDKLDRINQDHKEHYHKILIQLNRAKTKKKDFIKANLGIKRTTDEQRVYESELKKMDSGISFIEKHMMSTTESERNGMIEALVFLDVLRNVAGSYKDATYVRKRTIIDFFVSNISLDKQKRLTIAVKPDLQHLFSSLSGDDVFKRKHVLGKSPEIQ